MSNELGAIAVVNGDADMMAIWHVAVDPVAQTARLCGAWVTGDLDTQRKVVAARRTVVLDDSSIGSTTEVLDHADGVIDLKATLAAIEQYTCGLDDIHYASRTPKGSRRAPITWPTLPHMLDWAALPEVPAGVVKEPIIRSTIAVARWMADLADAWAAIETTRTSKPHLSEQNPSPLPIPFVLQ